MSRLLGKSKVWGRGYTTVPVTVRRVLGINDGDEIEWYLTEGDIIVKKVEEGSDKSVSRGQ